MGFLSRLRTLGSKKSKLGISCEQFKNNDALCETPSPPKLQVSPELRHISSKYQVRCEVDSRSLPPIVHPIHRVCAQLKIASPDPRTPPAPSSDAYTVTVHPRTAHACIKFPCLPTASDKQQLLLSESDNHRGSTSSLSVERFSEDPSITSLIAMYDHDGRPRSDAFQERTPPKLSSLDNSPRRTLSEVSTPRSLRALRRTNGGLRRMLLGSGKSDTMRPADPDESGDIVEWMEKQLGSKDVKEVVSLHDGLDMENESRLTRPVPSLFNAVSSKITTSRAMAIEEISELAPCTKAVDGKAKESPSPPKSRRASQVFGFLMKSKHSPIHDGTCGLSVQDTIFETPTKPCLPKATRDNHDKHKKDAVQATADKELGGQTGENSCLPMTGSYRLYHLPGRPEFMEPSSQKTKPAPKMRVTYPPSHPYTTNLLWKASRSESHLVLNSKQITPVQRKAPPFDSVFNSRRSSTVGMKGSNDKENVRPNTTVTQTSKPTAPSSRKVGHLSNILAQDQDINTRPKNHSAKHSTKSKRSGFLRPSRSASLFTKH